MLPFLDTAIIAIVALVPLLAITVGGGSAIFYLLLLACLAACCLREGGWRASVHSLRPYRGVVAALFVMLGAIVISQIAHGNVHGPSIERGARVSVAFPIFLAAMLGIDRRHLQQALWGVVLAGLTAAAIVFWLALPAFVRPDTPQHNAVTYGNLMLLFLVLAAYGTGWHLTAGRRLESGFKVAAAAVVFAAFILTQTRTGWMAIPLFVVVGLWLFAKVKHPGKMFAALGVACALLVALGSTNEALRARVAQGIQEAEACQGAGATADTSVCIRLQLWRASRQIIEEHPLFGLGNTQRFIPELEARVATGVVSPFVSQNFGEPHNDMLNMLTSYGVLGGVALILLYGAPAVVFFRRLGASHPREVRVAAAMGLALTLGFAVFGLTELMFRTMKTLGLYVILAAWLLALSDGGAAAPPRARAPR